VSAINPRRSVVAAFPSAEEWHRLESVVDALLDAPPNRRAALLAKLGAGDAARQAEIMRVVAECERAYPPLEGVAADRFAAVFADDEISLPEVLGGRYRLGCEVGRGGMAIVYLAHDLKHSRDVAVKIVQPELAAALGRTRFLREIEIAARLQHPHIVPVYDSGEEAIPAADPELGEGETSILYYVMPYEPGPSLRERLSREGPLPVNDAVLVLHDVCEALSHAHQRGIVHRDIKPDNILFSGRHAMVSDFGIARAVSEAAEVAIYGHGLSFGTPAYMAPEQAARDPHIDHRADIYALGALAYEMLAGRPPFTSNERHQTLPDRTANELKPLRSIRSDVPDGLAAAIMKCLEDNAADRWESADQLLAHLALIIPGASASTVAPHRSRRTLLLLGAAAAAALVVVIAAMRDHAESAPLLFGHAGELTSDPGLEVQPSISPDGRQVAYAAGHSTRMHIFVRPLAGGAASRLLADTAGNEWLPRWAPDGKRILFLSSGGAFTAPASGGGARREVTTPPRVGVTSPTWSTHGREKA
jgi:hypothetical protein